MIIACLELAGDAGLAAAPAATPPPVQSEVTAWLQSHSGPSQPETIPNITGPAHPGLVFFFVTPAVRATAAGAFSSLPNNTSAVFSSAWPRGPTRWL